MVVCGSVFVFLQAYTIHGHFIRHAAPEETQTIRTALLLQLSWAACFYWMLFGQATYGWDSFARRRKAEEEKLKLRERDAKSSEGQGGTATVEKVTAFQQIRFVEPDARVLAADRTVGNTMEQSLIFLPLFWLSVFLQNAAEQRIPIPGLDLSGYDSVLPLTPQSLLSADFWLLTGKQNFDTNSLGIVWLTARSYFFFTYYTLPRLLPKGGVLRRNATLLHLGLCTVPCYSLVLHLAKGVFGACQVLDAAKAWGVVRQAS
eukprot:g1285.t1